MIFSPCSGRASTRSDRWALSSERRDSVRSVRIGSGRWLADFRELGVLVVIVWAMILIRVIAMYIWLPMVVMLCFSLYSSMSKRNPDGSLGRARVFWGMFGFALLAGPIVASASQHLYVAGLSRWANGLTIGVPETQLIKVDTTRIGTVPGDYRRILSTGFQRQYLNSRFYVESRRCSRGLGVEERAHRLIDSRDGRIYASIRAFDLRGEISLGSGFSLLFDVKSWGRENEKKWNAYVDQVGKLYSYNCHGEDC